MFWTLFVILVILWGLGITLAERLPWETRQDPEKVGAVLNNKWKIFEFIAKGGNEMSLLKILRVLRETFFVQVYPG